VLRAAAGAGEQTLRWKYEPYLQRQLCFTSITGQFSCAFAEVEGLTENAEGEASLPAPPDQSAPSQATPSQATPSQAPPPPNPAAEAVRTDVIATLRTRADALFEDDRRLKLDPMLKTAGVSVGRPRVTRSGRSS